MQPNIGWSEMFLISALLNETTAVTASSCTKFVTFLKKNYCLNIFRTCEIYFQNIQKLSRIYFFLSSITHKNVISFGNK